jgi:hypothetical protein
LSGQENPFLWTSDEMECVESCLSVLIFKAAEPAAGRLRQVRRASRSAQRAGARVSVEGTAPGRNAAARTRARPR